MPWRRHITKLNYISRSSQLFIIQRIGINSARKKSWFNNEIIFPEFINGNFFKWHIDVTDGVKWFSGLIMVYLSLSDDIHTRKWKSLGLNTAQRKWVTGSAGYEQSAGSTRHIRRTCSAMKVIHSLVTRWRTTVHCCMDYALGVLEDYAGSQISCRH